MVRGNVTADKNYLALKFVLSKIKRLTIDEYGKSGHIENLDDIFKDIFGIKNFTKRLSDCYTNRETISVINEIGINTLMTICNTPRYFSSFTELVLMNVRMNQLNKYFRKAEKKGKHKNKNDVKEYKYIYNLYEEAIKKLRKDFGVAKKNSSYKKQFKTITDLVDDESSFRYYDDEDSIFFDNDSYGNDDDDRSTEFDRFVNRVMGPSYKKNNDQALSKTRTVKYLDDDDDEYEDEDDLDSEDDELASRVDALTDNISVLTSAVQALVNTNGGSASIVNKRSKAPAVTNDSSPEIANLTKAVASILKTQKAIVAQQEDFATTQNAILEFMDELADDDEESDPRPQSGYNNPQQKISNEPVITRDELIDIINSSKPANLGTAPAETAISADRAHESEAHALPSREYAEGSTSAN